MDPAIVFSDFRSALGAALGPAERDAAIARLYETLAAGITDTRFVFMNFGYSDPGGGDDLGWILPEDRIWRYPMNLVRRTIGDVVVAGRRVLDVGSGRGGACSMVARYLRAGEVWGLDACEGAVRRCRDAHRLDGVHFIHGDASALPFEDGRFDVVLNIESAHGYREPAAFFREVHRVLAPGGSFCFTDGPIDPAAIEPLMEDAGLRIVASEDVSAGVQRALVDGRNDYARLIHGFVKSGTASAKTAYALVEIITVDMPRLFREHRWKYHRWTLEKAPA